MTSETRTAEAPEILSPEPPPKPEVKSFHRRKLLGWTGKVDVNRIQGWVSNRRIDLFVRDFKDKFDRDPSSDDIYEFMKGEQEFELRALARNIAHNGIRVHIILDANGTLLDGNRRYFATKLAIDNRWVSEEDIGDIPAWVLTPDASEDDKLKILIETNFLPSYKVDWPNYIKALVMYEDYYERGLKFDQIAENYGMQKARVRDMVMAMDLIHEFIAQCDDPSDPDKAERATMAAYKHFVLFEEAHNKLRSQLDLDPDFKDQFFEWMLDDKFRGITEVRRLGEIRNDQEAWDAIRQDSPEAVKMAIHIVDEKKLPDTQDGERKVLKVIRTLRELKEWEIASIGPETMRQLRRVLMDVTAMAQAVNLRQQSSSDDGESNESAEDDDQ